MVIYHFIYKTIHKNGNYYIGRHSTTNINDEYFGSGLWIKKIKNKNNLSRIILQYANNIEELKLLESKYIQENFDNPKCKNKTKSSCGFTSEESLKLALKKISNNTHPFQNPEIGRKGAISALNRGIHPFQNPNTQRKSIKTRLIKGNHPTQIKRTCPHCNKLGTGPGMLRWHFNNCKTLSQSL